jgi:hypothetical protein
MFLVALLNLKTTISYKLHILIIFQIIETVILGLESFLELNKIKFFHQIYNFIYLAKLIYDINLKIYNLTYIFRNTEIYKIKIVKLQILSTIYLISSFISLYYLSFTFLSCTIIIFFSINYKKELKLLYKIIQNKEIIKLSIILIIFSILGSIIPLVISNYINSINNH